MIRKATLADIDFLYEMYMHPEVNPGLLYEQMDKESFQPIAQDLIDKGIKYIFFQDGRPVGMFKLVPYTHRAGHIVYLGGFAIHPAYGGRGLGGELIKIIIDFAREQGFKRIELTTDVINEKAAHIYEKAGFVREGILRKLSYFKTEDKYLDAFMMAYLL
jgi:L-phenylalanine/L-methionine N-acetyltransferase